MQRRPALSCPEIELRSYVSHHNGMDKAIAGSEVRSIILLALELEIQDCTGDINEGFSIALSTTGQG